MRSLSNQGLEIAGKKQAQLSPAFSKKNAVFGGYIPEEWESKLEAFNQQKLFKRTDRTVKLLLSLAETLKEKRNLGKMTLQIASSRGATQKWEEEHSSFSRDGLASPSSSPVTSLGNIASNLGQFLNINGHISENSMTCSSAGMSLMNGIAWLKSGMCTEVLIGSSEACLSTFTQAQMQALGILSEYQHEDFPCKALNLHKEKNSMVLGEAATLMLCSTEEKGAIASIESWGWAMDHIKHPSAIDSEGRALQESMKMALTSYNKPIDLVIAHAPGTILGDKAEVHAIQKVLGNTIPIISNKTVYGHTFSSSFLLNIMSLFGINESIQSSSKVFGQINQPNAPVKSALINAIGFGGQAVSAVVELSEH